MIDEGVTAQSLNPNIPTFLGGAVVLFVLALGLTLVGMVACLALAVLVFALR